MLRCISTGMAVLLLFSCSFTEPVKIGFIGGLTGRTADIGSHSRNGMILAVEEWNERGGLNGKAIEVIMKDDKQNAEQALLVVNELIDAEVDIIIGPSTSSIAVVVAPVATAANIPVFGTTVTTDDLSNIDDYFFRIVASTRSGTRHFGDFIYNNIDLSNYAIVSDLSNRAYTESWKNNLNDVLQAHGIELIFDEQFTSGDNLSLLNISHQLALLDTDMIVLVTNATDAALFIKQIRSINQNVEIATSEWAGTAQLLQLAGRDSEGIWVPRFIDESNQSDEFSSLRQRYEARFQQPMGYTGLLGYNVTQASLSALKNKGANQSIKEYLLEQKIYGSVMADFEINEFGDEVRNAFHFITQVQDGEFVTLKE